VNDEQKELRIEEWTYGYVIPQEELEDKFDRFWDWYKTITTAVAYDNETKKRFKILLHLEETIAEASSEIIWKVNRVIKSITYQRTFSNTDEIIEKIIEIFIFSKAFTLNEKETEDNKQSILTRKSQENTPEEGNTEESQSPKEEEIIIEEEDPISETDDLIEQNNEDQDEEIDINRESNSPSPEKSDSEESIQSNNTNISIQTHISEEPFYLQQLFQDQQNNMADIAQLRGLYIQLYGRDPTHNDIPRNIGDVLDAQADAITQLLTTTQNRNSGKIVDIPTYHGSNVVSQN
jgi:hypothetical protein